MHTDFEKMLIELLLKTDSFNLSVIAKEEKLKSLEFKNSRIKYFILPRRENKCLFDSIRNYLRFYKLVKNILVSQNIDVVILTTPQRIHQNFVIPKLTKRKKLIVICHNINYFYVGKESEFKKLQLEYGRYPLWKRLINLRLIRNTDLVFVLTEYLKLRMTKLFPNKKIEEVPFRTTTKEELTERINTLKKVCSPTFTITGFVNKQRRNYHRIFKAFSKVKNQNYRLVLLGEVVDKDIIVEGKEMLNDKLIYFENYISEKEYNKWLLKTHFLVGDINEKLPYGIFKATGIEFDGPSKGIPVLLPNNILNDAKNGLFIRYSHEKLPKLVNRLIVTINSGEYLKKYLKPAIEKARHFDKETWKNKIKVIINSVLFN